MRVLLDANVVIDILEKRKDFFEASYAVVKLAAEDHIVALLPAGSLSDIYYVVRRSGLSAPSTRAAIASLLQIVEPCDTTAADAIAALPSGLADFEDAIIAATAKREKADFIITRNETDFAQSVVPALSPTNFLKQL